MIVIIAIRATVHYTLFIFGTPTYSSFTENQWSRHYCEPDCTREHKHTLLAVKYNRDRSKIWAGQC